MNDPDFAPKLRWPLELRMEQFEDQTILLIRCPIGISKDPLALVPAVAPLIACFDGKLSCRGIAQRFAQQGATPELVLQLADMLDQNHFLDSPDFREYERETRRKFRELPVREAALAGGGYPADSVSLAYEIDQYLKHTERVPAKKHGSMLGLVSPHIDYRRGGMCYGTTYNALKQEVHDLIIVIGTSHQYSNLLFHLTLKDFIHPLARLSCDKDFVERLAGRYGKDRSFHDEFLHKNEHALELQLPFLSRVSAVPHIVPILVGSFHHMLASGKMPEEFDEYNSFAGILSECVAQAMAEGRRVCFLAGVDMAHVGQVFGDKHALTPEFMQEIERHDREYLDAILEQDKSKLFANIAQDGDARRVCGFPTMYTVIDVLDRLGLKYEGDLFDYRQAVDYDRDCAVTFAGIGLYQCA